MSNAINQSTMLSEIKREISAKTEALDSIHQARLAARGHQTFPSPIYAQKAPLAGHKSFRLLAQGDSWFDYPPGADLISCLHHNHGHTIDNIAVAGSTLNDEAYGPVPRELHGLPNIGSKQSDDPSRIAELVHRIEQGKPDALLISASGNDVVGDTFFSFINNALSGLNHVNEGTLAGVLTTFRDAYTFMIRRALEAAEGIELTMPVFVHGYDYPWPDGRGLLHFLGWRIGPWFDDVFNHKNYPNDSSTDLQNRHKIMVPIIDGINDMLQALAAEPEFQDKVFYVDLRGTLQSRDEWANELHPGNDGFAKLAEKIDAALQANI